MLPHAPTPPLIRLKYCFRNEIRMLTVPRTISLDDLSRQFRELTQQMVAGGSIPKEAKQILKYVDDDLVSIITERDLDECWSFYFEELQPKGMKLKMLIEYEGYTSSDGTALPRGWGGEPIKSVSSVAASDAPEIRSTPPLATPQANGGASRLPQQPITGWVKGNLIGQGACSEVYFGMDELTAKFFAVKQTPIDLKDPMHVMKVRRLQKEIDVMKHHHHDNIVQYLGSEKRDGYFNIFLEYVPGGSIASLLSKFGGFHEKVIRVYTRQILLGLEYLHSHGIIHRDIKGGNILVSDKGQVKLADFGCSKHNAHDTSTGDLSLRGTALWMAPEVIHSAKYGEASDIWSVGCTVIEMATGKPPWTNDTAFKNEVEALYYIAQSGTHPKLPPHLTDEAKDFLRLCFQQDPEARVSAKDLLAHPFITNEGPVPPQDLPSPPRGTLLSPASRYDNTMLTQTSTDITSREDTDSPEPDAMSPKINNYSLGSGHSITWNNICRSPGGTVVYKASLPLLPKTDSAEDTDGDTGECDLPEETLPGHPASPAFDNTTLALVEEATGLLQNMEHTVEVGEDDPDSPHGDGQQTAQDGLADEQAILEYLQQSVRPVMDSPVDPPRKGSGVALPSARVKQDREGECGARGGTRKGKRKPSVTRPSKAATARKTQPCSRASVPLLPPQGVAGTTFAAPKQQQQLPPQQQAASPCQPGLVENEGLRRTGSRNRGTPTTPYHPRPRP
eukprot:Sspe_Gene.38828::Locus_18725_Transcript_1_1_Confidence_1.000_Length_2292::g.38828::m.38828